MSLSTALSIAQNSLLNTQRQTSVVSKNMANQYNADYTRRAAVISSLGPGSQVASISRATNAALFKQNLSALSGWMAQSTIVEGLDHLQIAVNGVDDATSPAVLIGKMQSALEFFSAAPSNRTLAENVVETARQVALGLNQGTRAIQAFRTDLDRQIATAVTELNQLLADFRMVNDEIVGGTAAGRDVLDSLDRRDALLKKISEIVPVSTITRAGGDVMLVTADGGTLFETIPRHVHFEPTPAYGATSTGNGVFIDGVPLFSSTGANTTGSGTLAAMVQLRDGYANDLQLQLDEIARGLISAFSEPGGDGLFTSSSGTPSGAAGLTGLAGEIRINPLVDPGLAGDPLLLRDGITADYNPGDLASFNERLFTYLDKLDAPSTFTSASGATVSQSLTAYSAAAIGWLGDARKTAASAAEAKSALAIRSAEALSNATGVNVDEEMALLLELEHSYSASAKMLQVVDEMLKTLLAAVR
jgi:flagellar hook-associated protein 1 FlgK